jgi:hypothetical protein
MNGARATLLAAFVAHVLGWLLPVARGYHGWHAFRIALSPLWPYENFSIEPGILLVLSVASALTNVLFIALAILLVLREGRARAILWAAAGATLLNLHWPISMGDERRVLEGGYFVWVCSFVLLALAAFLALRATRR